MSDPVPASGKSPYRLYTRMMPVLGVAAVIASFAEADQRGLLFRSSDTAFFAEDSALAVPNGGTIAYLTSGADRPYGARRRTVAARPGARSGLAVIPATIEDPASAGGGASRLIDAAPAAVERPVTLSAISPAGTGTAVGGQPAPGPGFPESPIGLIADNAGNPDPNNPGPVVPAVPEPASWLLMIIGVGWLGLSLRRRKLASPPTSHTEVLTA